MSMHTDLRLSFRDRYLKVKRGDLAVQVPEAESQDAAYARWQERTDDAATVAGVEARYREALATENSALGRFTARHTRADLDKAIEVYDSLLAEHPDFANAACRIAYCYQTENSLEKALAAAVRATEADPLFELAYFCAGLVQKILGRPDDAAESYRKAISLNPRFAAARDNLGLILVDKGDFDGAIEQFTAILRDFPDAKNATANLALAQSHLSRTA